MKLNRTSIKLVLFSAILANSFYLVNAQTSSKLVFAKSQWVYPNSKGKLVYKTTEKGDKIMDFSHAGYMGGGVSIPMLPVKITVEPLEGDNTDAIQNAINEVSKMPLVSGFRGAVLLKPGTYNCSRPITINASGVVLRGSGSDSNGTVINMGGKSHVAISVRGSVTSKPIGNPTNFADAYVPSRAYSFNLKNVAGLSVGDTIRISKPVTDAWVKFMGMDQLVRNEKKQTWLSGEISTDRVIKKIEKNKVTVDIPLTDNYDAQYLNPLGVSVVKITASGELSQIGIENLRIVSPAQSGTINEGHHRAFTMSGMSDGWARNIEVFNTVNSVSITGKRITVDNLSIIHDLPTQGAAKPADINGSGQQLLFNRCFIKGDNLFFFGTGAKVTGPVVLLNCIFRGNGWIQPHQRWATGLLVDGCQVPDGGIDFMNRGIMGSGHGWSIGWAVAWNSKAKSFLNQQPPGSANWVIGGIGEKQKRAIPFDTLPLLPEGIYDAYNTPVAPASLYLAQLSERLGDQALQNIGYGNDLKVKAITEYIKPAVKKGGFKMEGYILWCPTVIKVGKTYHMFASRWPEQYGLGGWTKYSEIVRATSDDLYGPYTFQEVVIQKREGYWDNDRAHNPKIVKVGKTFVLYYISSANETGYAYANSITGPWKRVDKLPMPFSNPAPLVKKDGSIYVFGRKSVNDIRIAQGYTAPSFTATYTILKEGVNLLPGMNQLEDPTIWWAANQYNVILSDFRGDATGVNKNGAQYYSTDGINYQLVSNEPVYTKTVNYDDGSSSTFRRRERPFVYVNEKGAVTALFTSCLVEKPEGEQSWIEVNPVDHYVPRQFDKNKR